MGKKKKNQNNQPQIQPRPGGPAPRGVRGEPRRRAEPGEPRGAPGPAGAAPGSARPAGRRQPGGSGPTGDIFSFFTNPARFVPGENCPERSAPAAGSAPRCRQGRPRAAQSRAAAAPYLASRLSSFFFQFSARCMGSVSSAPRGAAPRAGEGSGRRSLPSCPRRERRLCRGRRVRAARRRGCRRARC